MKSESPLTAGKVLKVPVKTKEEKTAVASAKKGKSKKAASEPTVVRYTVKKGETLTQIAKRYGTTPAAIQKMNHLQTTQLKSGQVLKIRNPNSEAGG